ncbi:MAG: DUF1566 domain-containing protein [Polyangiales bacterium]
MPDVSGRVKPNIAVQGDVVVDKVTGLVWQGGSVDETCKSPEGGLCSLAAASEYCDGLVLAGSAEWRLPTAIEVQSTFVLSPDGYVYDRALFPSPKVERYLLWTRPLQGSDRTSLVYSSGGVAIDQGLTDSLAQVRCVSGGHRAVGSRYAIDEALETIADNWTTLTWRRNEESGLFSFAEAQNRCASLGEGWRVPSAKELLTLVTPDYLQRCIDRRVFGERTASELWGSTEDVRSDGEVGHYGMLMRVSDAYRCGEIVRSPMEQRRRLAVRCVR